MRVARGSRPSINLLVGGVVLAAVAGALGFTAATVVRSPAQVLADAAAPPPTALTEAVTVQRVNRTVTFDGVVVRRHSVAVPAPAGGEDSVASILTRRSVEPGDGVRNGDLVAEVSGRPVIVLEGTLPAYRTLRPGSEGADVRQLQSALAAAGLYHGSIDGDYDTYTAEAVADLYESHGYEARVVGEDEVAAAEEAYQAADRSYQQARDGGDKLAVQYAARDRDRALQELAAARAQAGAEVSAGEIAYVPRLPAHVGASPGQLGSPVGTTLVTLESGPLVVRGTPLGADGKEITRRDKATLLLTPTGERRGRVASVAAQAGAADTESPEGGVPGGGPEITIVPNKMLKPNTLGTAVRVRVTVEAATDTALAVPISAITTTATGHDEVTVLRDGTRLAVRVTPGFAGDGYVQVTPADQKVLHEGDQVLVGDGR